MPGGGAWLWEDPHFTSPRKFWLWRVNFLLSGPSYQHRFSVFFFQNSTELCPHQQMESPIAAYGTLKEFSIVWQLLYSCPGLIKPWSPYVQGHATLGSWHFCENHLNRVNMYPVDYCLTIRASFWPVLGGPDRSVLPPIGMRGYEDPHCLRHLET